MVVESGLVMKPGAGFRTVVKTLLWSTFGFVNEGYLHYLYYREQSVLDLLFSSKALPPATIIFPRRTLAGNQRQHSISQS